MTALRDLSPSLALGLEMVQKPFQAGLDAWVAGELDEAALRDAIEWDELDLADARDPEPRRTPWRSPRARRAARRAVGRRHFR